MFSPASLIACIAPMAAGSFTAKMAVGRSPSAIQFFIAVYPSDSMPEHHWLESHGKTFLVVRVQTCSGTGVAFYRDRLFTLTPKGLREVLDYPAESVDRMKEYERLSL